MVTMCFANLIQPAWKLSSFDKDVLEHTELRVHQYEQGIQQLSNPPLTGQPMFSMVFINVFMGFPNDGIAVPLGPLWFLPSWRRSWCNGVNMVILTVGGLVSNTSDVNEWQTRDACGNQG